MKKIAIALILLGIAAIALAQTGIDRTIISKFEGKDIIFQTYPTSGSPGTEAARISDAGVLQVDTITNEAGTGAPTLTNGVSVTGNGSFTGKISTGDLIDSVNNAAPNVTPRIIQRNTYSGSAYAFGTELTTISHTYTDNVYTSIFRVFTNNEGVLSDNGGYTVVADCMICSRGANACRGAAGEAIGDVQGWQFRYSRVMRVSTGENTSCSHGAITINTGDTLALGCQVVSGPGGEYEQRFQASVNTSSGTSGTLSCQVKLVWFGFITPPIIDDV